MPAKDVYHNTVRTALEKDGWIITDDPLIIRWGKKDLYIDLDAEKLLGAQKNGEKIAVEIKSFLGKSAIEAFEEVFEEPIGKVLLENKRFKMLIFDEIKEVIIQWIV